MFILGKALSTAVQPNTQILTMASTSKKGSKSKNKSTQNDSQSQDEEPELTTLSQEIEKRARKSKKSQVNRDVAISTGMSTSEVLSAPESLPKDLIQEMRFEIDNMKKQNREQQEEMVILKDKVVSHKGVDYQWKKEGNRKQYEVIYQHIVMVQQAKDKYRHDGLLKGEESMDTLVNSMNQRIKMLRIADTSPHGWQTVQEYEVNPIARDDADDQKLRRAERAAQEKIAIRNQERKAKQSRFHPYGGQGNYRYQNQNQNYQNEGAGQEGQSGYKAYGGFKSQNSYKSSTVVQDKQTPKCNRNNDICFQCGSRGHWANHCPERKQMESTDEANKKFKKT